MQALTVLALAVIAAVATQAPAPAVPVDAVDRVFDSKGVPIRYVEQGQGSPVVLLHGYTGTLERHWITPGVFRALARDHRAIAIDCRGHGKSGKPHDPQAYGAEMGQDVVRLLDHLKIPRAHIIGYSMGAIIVGHLVTTDPDRFITATLLAHHAVHEWTEADAQEAKASAQELESGTPFKSLVIGFNPPGKPVPSDEEIRKYMAPVVAVNDLKALAAYNRGRPGLVAAPRALTAVRVPMLGIIGSGDPAVDSMRALATLMPALKLIVVDGAEHTGERGIIRRPEFLAALREFLAAHR